MFGHTDAEDKREAAYKPTIGKFHGDLTEVSASGGSEHRAFDSGGLELFDLQRWGAARCAPPHKFDDNANRGAYEFPCPRMGLRFRISDPYLFPPLPWNFGNV